MREWIIQNALADAATLDKIEEDAKNAVRESKTAAWSAYLTPIKNEIAEVGAILDELAGESEKGALISPIKNELVSIKEPIRKDIQTAVKKVLRLIKNEETQGRQKLISWLSLSKIENHDR